MSKYNFQYCQKIVVFSEDNSKVLLARRKGEADFDSVYSFIGGKMENTDGGIVEGMLREKNEEVGSDFKIRLYPIFNTSNFFVKKDGNAMILPHYYAQYVSGEVSLNEEYSDFRWVHVEELGKFEPKIPNIAEMVNRLLRLVPLMKDEEFVVG